MANEIMFAGTSLKGADKALILLHGRGGSAADIISLADHLDVKNYAVLAPEAEGNTWYPYSFLSPPAANQPWLDRALERVNEVVETMVREGIGYDKIYLAGFSQGACLTLEYAARHAKRYGGIAAFTGGLIGDKLYPENYRGNFDGTPVFIASADPDPHIPVERVTNSAKLLTAAGATVHTEIYPGMGHTITMEEIRLANKLIFN